MKALKNIRKRATWVSSLILAVAPLALADSNADSAATQTPRFKKIMIMVFENTDYKSAITQPFISQLIRQGGLLTNFMAEGHPSQPNYVALISGSTNGVTSDSPVNLSGKNVTDLIEAKGLQWKAYAEDYPGSCYLGTQSGKFVRKHLPFLSFTDIQKSPARCARIVEANQLQTDIDTGALPDYSFYVPNLDNDGHDTNVAYADQWLSTHFAPNFRDRRFMQDMLFVLTFDESESHTGPNQVVTILLGDAVAAGSASAMSYNHYSLLKMVENQFALGTLGREDDGAMDIMEVWK